MKYPEVAKRLTLAMNAINIKAVDLARKSEVSKASISQYMNGSHCPSNKKAQQLADVLNVSPLWLMDLDDNMQRPATIIPTTDHILSPNSSEKRIETVMNNIKGFAPDKRERVLSTIEAIIDVEKKSK